MTKKSDPWFLSAGTLWGSLAAIALGALAYNFMSFRIAHCNSEECNYEINATRILVTVVGIGILAGIIRLCVNRKRHRP
ncbi:hypothetical protein [Sphingobium sp. SA916]|uniref:hypothetical protein n=1 Tax=Sphingobium sp. SA916 TaxID=1851207 RepID=UPI0011AFC169|nr:hypothetical protein [Sphingobium sp. SA916]